MGNIEICMSSERHQSQNHNHDNDGDDGKEECDQQPHQQSLKEIQNAYFCKPISDETNNGNNKESGSKITAKHPIENLQNL